MKNTRLQGSALGTPWVRGAALEAHTGSPAPVAAVSTATAGIGNRLSLLMVLLPVLLLCGLMVNGLAHRIAPPPAGARVAESEAYSIARDAGLRVTDGPVEAVSATLHTAYSLRHQSAFREWGVICTTTQGKFLFRINAATGRLYAINRLSGKNDDLLGNSTPPQSPPAMVRADIGFTDTLRSAALPPAPPTARETRSGAHLAWEFLGRLGIPTEDLDATRTRVNRASPPDRPEDDVLAYTYPWRGETKGDLGIKVTVNVSRQTLENFWDLRQVQ